MLKKSLFIIIPIVLIIGLIFGYGIKSYNSKYVTFQADGHFIAKNSKSSTKKYFFDTNSKYKASDDEVVVTDKKNEIVTIPATTFIHYTDGSVSTFSKTVVLDLNDMNKENYTYYNVFPNTIFVKNGNSYSVNYLDKKLKFSNFLLKINDEKFMIVGQKIKLTIGDNVRNFDNTYLEISYLEGNVIKIENQSVAFQSVSDNVLIELDGKTIVDFVGKNIYQDQERKLSLGEITIDGKDNVEINAEDNKLITGEKAKKGEDDETENGTNGSNSGTNGGSNKSNTTKKYTKEELPNISTGVVDTSTNTTEEIIDANARIKDAEFKIINMDVTANRIRAEVQITDEAAVLEGPVRIKIIESSTNKVVHERNDESGSNIIEIEEETLTPETNYVLVLNSDYKKNEVLYNKDFIQKTFVTDAVGVSLEKYFVSSSALQVNVKKSSYSEVASVKVALEDNSERVLKTIELSLDEENNIVDFEDYRFQHDTKYKVRVYDFIYNDAVITSAFTIVKNYETLKEKPRIEGTPTFTIDKKEAKFNMQMNNVIDPDGGILSYKYEVYDNSRTFDVETTQPVTTIEKTNLASASIKVDGTNIRHNVPYVFRVVMTFNDNEKEYDYVSGFSTAMIFDGSALPLVVFHETEVTYERIIGNIEIIDDEHTIDLEDGSLITVTYTDSVGEAKTISSSGSLFIPIDINGLRSNDTYSFVVKARVDLHEDFNEPIDSLNIGAFVVQTKIPDAFKVVYTPVDDLHAAFSVKAQLVRGSGDDTELEANTLTGFNINLYEGTNTAGKLVKTVKKVDGDLRPYVSELRSECYDDSFIINPTFFGKNNSDLKAANYTIEITSAYDYTKYKNNLPIEANTIVVKLKETINIIIGEPLEYMNIKNKDMGDDKRSDLLDGTVTGFRFKSTYDNSKNQAKVIHYYIKNTQGQVLKTIDYVVPANGSIGTVEFYLDDGLEKGEADDKLHRGRRYLISQSIELDLDGDGSIDYNYEPDTMGFDFERQAASFKFYPSQASASTYSWKYTYKDIDHALLGRKATSTLDGESPCEKTLSPTSEFSTVTFNVAGSGLFAIYGNYNYIDEKDTISTSLIQQYYEGVSEADFGSVAVQPRKNKVIFMFNDFESKPEFFSRVSSVKIDFVSGSDRVTIDGLSIKAGSITVNYALLKNLLGKTITPQITIYYDSGIYGFENQSSYFAIQQIRPDDETPLTYYSFEGRKFNSMDSADGSFVTYNFDAENEKLTINDQINDSSKQYDISITPYGVLANDGDYISPKKLYEANIPVSENPSFVLDEITPGVSIRNEYDLSSIKALINSATVKITLFGEDGQLRDDEIYLELWKTDMYGQNPEFIRTITVDINNLDSLVEITNLLPQTYYYFRIYGYINNQQRYLEDTDTDNEGELYSFVTMGNVGIKNISAKYNATSYDNRTLKLSYSLTQTGGYTYIRYDVYKIVPGEDPVLLPGVTADRSLVFRENMNAIINIPNDSGFVTGDKYLIRVQPVLSTRVDGEDVDIELEYGEMEFAFNTLYKPSFNVTASTSTNSVSYTVNVRDYHKTIVDGNYKVEMRNMDTGEILDTPYNDQDYDISGTGSVNRKFVFDNLQANTNYAFSIIYFYDVRNDINQIETGVFTKTTKIKGSEIDVGEIYADPDLADSTKINLRFFGSNLLTNAKILRYSIYNSDMSFSRDDMVAFLPELMSSGDVTYYQFRLTDTINQSGFYYISMQFLDSSQNILAESSVTVRMI